MDSFIVWRKGVGGRGLLGTREEGMEVFQDLNRAWDCDLELSCWMSKKELRFLGLLVFHFGGRRRCCWSG